MAWSGSTRRERLPSDWPTRRQVVLRRDAWRCVAVTRDGDRCTEAATDVDHIRPGDDHSLDNLQALCRWHHGRKSAYEGVTARAARPRPGRARPVGRHPADL
ncbi:HNH endonuclease [Streptomyces sp. XY431]|nr:HNH endonuclease [Streptomyces sp. XY431]